MSANNTNSSTSNSANSITNNATGTNANNSAIENAQHTQHTGDAAAKTYSATSQSVQTDSMRKPWYACATPLLGKAVRAVAQLRGGGTALPGKIVEDIDPGFLARSLAQLPYGVVLVSGTNGKTTTTRMVASLFEQCGLKVFTNPTGSNFTRGVISALLQTVDMHGRLDADIAVLELDEAYAVHFVHKVRPRAALLLNVMRDQLDRFGEIDYTAQLLGQVAAATDGIVVLNREDPRIAALAHLVPDGTQVRYFGLERTLRDQFPSDDNMQTICSVPSVERQSVDQTKPDADADADATATTQAAAEVTLASVGNHHAVYRIDNQEYATDMRIEGLYNLYNAAAALALVRSVIPHMPVEQLIRAVAQVTPAFGRGESIEYNGTSIELVLVKNPMGFRLALASFSPVGIDTMIAINDEYADGRDMSWLWDVDFTSLRDSGAVRTDHADGELGNAVGEPDNAVGKQNSTVGKADTATVHGVRMVSGVRAWDMALRLQYDQVPVAEVEPNIAEAVDQFINANTMPKRIYCTYTAMLAIRSHLSHTTHVADVGLK